MDDKPTKQGGGAAVVLVLVAILVLLPMLYVLSVGPIIWMVHSGFISDSSVSVLGEFYRPLEWVTNKVPVIGPAIDTYANWWQPTQSVFTPAAGS
jgi:uncharacterized membrane protein